MALLGLYYLGMFISGCIIFIMSIHVEPTTNLPYYIYFQLREEQRCYYRIHTDDDFEVPVRVILFDIVFWPVAMLRFFAKALT